MTLLIAEKLAKRFGKNRLFSGIDLTLSRGEVVTLLGPNGSGKSTLLKILAGLVRPDRGAVHLVRDGARLPVRERGRDLGLASPEVNIYLELTPLENMRFIQRVRGQRVTREEMDAWLERTGLTRHARLPMQVASSGMRQRLKLILAATHRPLLLLLDEPGSNLDQDGHAFVRALIAEQRERGATIIATNDPQETAYGDRSIQLGS